jgi:heptosyltransferase-1
MSSEYRGLAELLGLETGDFALDVVVGDEDDAFARDLAARDGLGAGYAALVPFTTKPQKHWVEDRWPAVVAGVQEALGLPSVILGGPGDRDPASRIVAACPDSAVDLAGGTTLGQAAAVVRRARLLIGVDTALTHLGTAFRVPTVALFGATTPYLDPLTATTRILYHRMPCSPCVAHPTCDGAFTCMKRIGAEEILAAARDLASAGAPDP